MAAEAIVARQVASVVAAEMEKAVDEEIDRLDNMTEDDYAALRRKRINEMKKEKENKEKWKREGHGELQELQTEKDFFDLVKKSQRVVALFVRQANIHADTLREHLAVVAAHHLEARFVVLDAEKSPFLVQRLKVWMIPSIVLIIDQKTHHTIVGLDELTGDGKYTTVDLEQLLNKHHMLSNHTLADRASTLEEDEDDDFDW
eukprot:CAMPEP_0119136992 /NCGR_PEP_ID=MMETSP1310-20130426/22642_1 /TAXON_ID=464262 /ORGANISM="Genus nov. species nov., Strain RCC2339" /LENGTH=201 /DNA_ID=CAMNT_0007128039 /DNA_START=102 /DNA_END=704 /DNA_ORIENTATION=+